MPIHTLKLISRRAVASATITCDFEKPARFTFRLGQYGGFTHINPAISDPGGMTRRFSLLSTPDDHVISIVTRIQQSVFKKVLSEMPIESQIKFAGPSGNFTLHENYELPAVLIAGGIGIAPFFSIIRHHSKHQPQRQIVLFYGNQSKATTAFHEELAELAHENKNFNYIPVMANDAAWQGEAGFITHTLIKKYVPDLQKPVFYVCGAPAMVTALQETLLEMDIPTDNIKVEDFPGY